jgi:hypothetical protein
MSECQVVYLTESDWLTTSLFQKKKEKKRTAASDNMGLLGPLFAPILLALLLAALRTPPCAGLVITRPSVFPSTLDHAVAAFGPQVIGDPVACAADSDDCFPAVTAQLVGLHNHQGILGCDASDLPDKLPSPFIMVAMRDDCVFAVKARVAQDAGASALIVYDSVPGEPLEIMREDDGAKITIPAIFVTAESGDEILQLLALDSDVVAVINATGNLEWKGDNWQLTVLWFLFIAFIAVSGAGLCFFLFFFSLPPKFFSRAPPPPTHTHTQFF